MTRILVLCVLLMGAVSLAACVGVGGTVNNHRPTVGQELIDLKAALDQHLITQAEYDQKKAELLAGH